MSKAASFTSSSVTEAGRPAGMEKKGTGELPADAGIEKVRARMTAQLNELEVLESMYSMPGEFYLHDPEAKAKLDDFCMDKAAAVPPEISYDIRLQCVDSAQHNVEPVEVVATVTYPLDYPDKAPTVYVRLLNHYHTRQHQHYLNKTLTAWIKNLSKGDPCILQIFSWIEQNTTSYVSSIRPQQLSSVENDTENQPKDVEFERLWIYSHHIYSREKRECVAALARNLELTGFMLIGKPGVICVEGSRQDTRAFWEQIRRLTWQRITLKHQENATVGSASVEGGFGQQQKFAKFTEMTGASLEKPGTRDMAEVFRFLRQHHCDTVIPLLFGVNATATTATATTG